MLFERAILEGRGRFPARRAWRVEARGVDLDLISWVDAGSGVVLLAFDQRAYALSRLVYDAGSR